MNRRGRRLLPLCLATAGLAAARLTLPEAGRSEADLPPPDQQSWVAVKLDAPKPDQGDAATEAPLFSQSGMASWYGKTLQDKSTATGEAFDGRAWTAAHRDLTFGDIARVTNLETGQTVKVRINDRGPYVDGRIIDLSPAAGAQIGIRESGTALVQIEVFASDQVPDAAAPPRRVVQERAKDRSATSQIVRASSPSAMLRRSSTVCREPVRKMAASLCRTTQHRRLG